MHAVPCRPVRDLVPGVSLEAGEKLLVEISRKFTPASIAALAEEAGLVLQVPRGRGPGGVGGVWGAGGCGGGGRAGLAHGRHRRERVRAPVTGWTLVPSSPLTPDAPRGPQGVWRVPGYSVQMLMPALEALRAAWADTDAMFGLLADWDAVPISLRNPFSFYYGHMASFARGRLLPGARVEALDQLYSRGIDPKVSDPSICHAHPPAPPAWPAEREVRAYVRGAREGIAAVGSAALAAAPRRLAMALEHERMHQETLCYMLAQQRKQDWRGSGAGRGPVLRPHADGTSYLAAWRYRDAAAGHARDTWVTVPARTVRLGTAPGSRRGFAWDNELGAADEQALPDLRVAARPVTAAQFKAFIDAANVRGLGVGMGWSCTWRCSEVLS